MVVRMGPKLSPPGGGSVTHVEAEGCGSALMGNIAAAREKFIIMGNAHDSCDFLEIPRFIEKLCEGFGLVQGRLPSGGGQGNARRHAVFALLVE